MVSDFLYREKQRKTLRHLLVLCAVNSQLLLDHKDDCEGMSVAGLNRFRVLTYKYLVYQQANWLQSNAKSHIIVADDASFSHLCASVTKQ